MTKKLLIIILFAAKFVYSQVYTYEWIEGGPPDTIKWILRQTDINRYEILSLDPAADTSQWMLCDESFYTLKWFFKNTLQGKRFKGWVYGDTITIEGQSDNKDIYKQIYTSGLPWVQFYAFALSHFVDSGQEYVKFLSVSPNSFRAGNFIARRHEVEEVPINRITEKAVHVKVHLSGILYYLGWVNFWFRERDHVFIYFKGKTDIFGPVTYCTLLDIQQGMQEPDSISTGNFHFDR